MVIDAEQRLIIVEFYIYKLTVLLLKMYFVKNWCLHYINSACLGG